MDFNSTGRSLSNDINKRLKELTTDQLRQMGIHEDDIFYRVALKSVSGGKRLRGQQVFIGAQLSAELLPSQEMLLDVACALEFYQCAALVHDDVVDRACERRGGPSAHVAFTADQNLSQHFGTSAAIFLGDFFLAMADKMMASSPSKVIALYSEMALQVALGQFLELQQANLPVDSLARIDYNDYFAAIDRIVKLKSARYSVVYPILIGAALAGATEEHLEALDEAIEPLGIAFQMRDDALGIFGNRDQTGKPVGDDIREGKRTRLLGFALKNATEDQKQMLVGGIARSMNSERVEGASAVAEVTALLEELAEAEHENDIAQKRETSWNLLSQICPNSAATAAREYLFSQLLDRAD